jgi:hypothetical protein
MSVLVIGIAEQHAIAAAIVAARAKPIPWSVLADVAVADDTNTLPHDQRNNAKIAEIRAQYPLPRVRLGGFDVSISFEEQPTGLYRHLSIAVPIPGRVPNEYAIKMIVEAFGSVWPPTGSHRMWGEEYEPGKWAFNIVEAAT